ncbi:unnamed protein product [Echinostoma caproni]|uniref:Uncharacterized protein n=1 Tax=Echinostoma caproni TaxID=27848 RepID=A0A183B976_9TREM|nr:unnamed protein product [Echinostoma caproni]
MHTQERLRLRVLLPITDATTATSESHIVGRSKNYQTYCNPDKHTDRLVYRRGRARIRATIRPRPLPLNIGDVKEWYPHPATADKLGQRNAWQSKHDENTELEVQEPGHILARSTSPATRADLTLRYVDARLKFLKCSDLLIVSIVKVKCNCRKLTLCCVLHFIPPRFSIVVIYSALSKST